MLKRKTQLWILGIALFITNMAMMMIYTVLPLYVKSLGGTEYKIGLAMGLGCFGYFVGSPLWGWISDKTKKRVIYILLGPFGFVLMAGALAISKTANQIAFSHFMGSLIASSFYPVLMAYVSDITTQEVRGRWMGVMTGLLTLAMAFGAFLAGLVMSRGFKQTFWLTGGIGLAAMILVATIMWKGNKAT